MAKNPRCQAFDKKGLQCGRTTADPSGFCHIHLKKAGQQTQFQSAIDDPREILQRLMHSADEGIRLRAAEKYLDRLDKEFAGCARCATQNERLVPQQEALKRMIPAQLEELREMMARVKELLALTLRQPIYEPPIERPIVASRVSGDSAIAPQFVPVERPTIEEPSEPVVPLLPRAQWPAAGLYLHNGVVSHALGDEHAAQILEGVIPYEQAVKAETAGKKSIQ